MKNPDSPRAYPPPAADPYSAEGHEEARVPRYVQAPALRDHGMGPRNLFWGVALIVLAFIALLFAVALVGAKALVSVAACLLTLTALFVLTRAHVFRQRNGGFLGVAAVCLIGAIVPLLERGYSSLRDYAASRPSASAPVVSLHSEEQGTPLLMQAFALPAEPPGDGKQVRVVRDTRVVIDNKPFLIKAGDRFPLITSKNEQATFAVRDLLLSLPTTEVEIVDPNALANGVAVNPSVPAGRTAQSVGGKGAAGANSGSDAQMSQITKDAQMEAMRMYPALAVPHSMENEIYVSTYKQLKEANWETFADPKWPIALANMLAKDQGWVPGAAPMTTGPAPAPILDAPKGADATNPLDANTPAPDAVPADPIPADPPQAAPIPRAQPVRRAPVNVPPINMLDAGDGLPRAGGPGR